MNKEELKIFSTIEEYMTDMNENISEDKINKMYEKFLNSLPKEEAPSVSENEHRGKVICPYSDNECGLFIICPYTTYDYEVHCT